MLFLVVFLVSFYVFFILVFWFACWFSDERERNGVEDLGGDGGRQRVIRIYCMMKFFQLKVIYGKISFQRLVSFYCMGVLPAQGCQILWSWSQTTMSCHVDARYGIQVL